MKTKEWLKGFLTSLMLILSVDASAGYFEVDGIWYQYDSESSTIVRVSRNRRGDNYSGAITIPLSVTYNSKTYSVTGINNYAFYNCTGLTSIEIPNSVTEIGWDAFDGCTSLTSINIPNSVTNIGMSVFKDCTGLTSIDIPNSLTEINGYAFEGCTGLTSIDIPNSVTRIEIGAFKGCTGLTSIEIPNSVEYIGQEVFEGCTGLTSIEIPNSVTEINNKAFSGCTNLSSIKVKSGNTVYDSREDCNAIIETSTNTLIMGCKSTKIPNSVTDISLDAFSGCTGLTSIDIPNSVTEIWDGAFSGCTGLSSIKVENGNTVYDSREDCNAIIETSTNTLIMGCKSTKIPNSVAVIRYDAFSDCTSLISVEIPSSVTEIQDASSYLMFYGYGAFLGCTGLTSIKVEGSNTVYDSREDCNAIIRTSTNTLIIGCKSTKIPNSVTQIGDFAFSRCTGLTSIDIPNSVTQIGDDAFQDCTGLTSIDIPNSVTQIGDDAFSGCTGLTSIDIPNSVTEIGNYAFYNCTGLASIDIPGSVTEIGNYAFYNCTGLTSINIPNSVTEIGNYAFYNCTGLASIDIPNSVTEIGSYAFLNCFGLTSIELSSSVTTIKGYAFNYCTNLEDIYCTNPVPCTLENIYAFDDTHYAYTTLHVPVGSLAAYQAAEGWKEFKNIVDDVPAYATYAIHAISVDEQYGTVAIENGGEEVIEGTSVTVTAEPKAGYKFTNWMEGDVVVSSENPYTFEAAKDINLVAHFAPATYKVTYIVDGEEYKVIEVTYGEAIPAEAEPTKEGYIFSGWSEIPETMPAEDVTITGTFVFDYNADAYQRLNGQIAELQNSLNAAKETINTECADVTAQFVEQITSIQNSIDALSADVKAKYEAGELSAESNIDTASVVAAIKKLLADAQSAQQAYEAEQEKIAANEAAYTRLMQEIAELQAKLDAAKETINAECKDVAEQFTEQLASIQNAIDALLNDINAQYANCALTVESTINVADVIVSIETTTEAAAEAQKNHEETVGIDGVGSNGAKVKAIYNLNGKRVSTTKPNQMYIIEYSDGRKVKAIVKK